MVRPWQTRDGFAITRAGGSLPGSKPPGGRLCASYRCYSMACLDRPGLEFGDKIIMPQSAFREAHRLSLSLPLLFKIVNTGGRGIEARGPSPSQFCGVLEFSAPHDQVYLPYWMMQNLLLVEGAFVELRSITHPPLGSFVRFRPQDDVFIGLAARQGPKALMEDALRRYSVLSEGVTILVQHEGENFYLDVVEIRTTSSSPVVAAAAAIVSNAGSQNPGHCIGGESGGDGGTDDGGGCGKRISIVSLLGDLDLEVEFCSVQAERASDRRGESQPVPLDDGAARVDNCRGSRGEKTNDQTRKPSATTSSTMLSGVEKERQSSLEASSEIALPPPAKAKREKGDVTLHHQRQRTGSLGISPAAPPRPPAQSARTKCRAFLGTGFTLGDAGADMNENCTHNVRASPGSIEQTTKGWGHCGSGGSHGSDETAEVGRGVAALRGSDQSGVATDVGGSTVSAKEAVLGGGAVLGEGSSSSTAAVEGAAAGFAGRTKVVANEETETVACESCGKLISVSNYSIHTLRCAVRLKACGIRQPTSLTRQNTGSDEIERHGMAHIATHSSEVVAGERIPGEGRTLHIAEAGQTCRRATGNGGIVRGAETLGGRKTPPLPPHAANDDSRSSPLPVVPNTTTTGGPDGDARPRSPTTNMQGRNPVSNNTNTKPISSSALSFPCAYCGLSFKAADAAVSHEIFCGTRTDRCDRCCGHVPRRDAESHRRPGGACDVAIAAAVEVGQNSATVENSARFQRGGLDAKFLAQLVGGDGSGVRDNDGRSYGRGLGRGVGLVDSLLAEAVRSSKQASTALGAVQAKNTRLLNAVGVTGCKKGWNGVKRQNSACLARPHENIEEGVEGIRVFRGNHVTRSDYGEGTHGGGGQQEHALDRKDASRYKSTPDFGIAGNSANGLLTPSGENAQNHGERSLPTSERSIMGGRAHTTADEGPTLTGPCDEMATVKPYEGGSGGGTSGGGITQNIQNRYRHSPETMGLLWTCSRCTLDNPVNIEICEACGLARERPRNGGNEDGIDSGTPISPPAAGGSIVSSVAGRAEDEARASQEEKGEHTTVSGSRENDPAKTLLPTTVASFGNESHPLTRRTQSLRMLRPSSFSSIAQGEGIENEGPRGCHPSERTKIASSRPDAILTTGLASTTFISSSAPPPRWRKGRDSGVAGVNDDGVFPRAPRARALASSARTQLRRRRTVGHSSPTVLTSLSTSSARTIGGGGSQQGSRQDLIRTASTGQSASCSSVSSTCSSSSSSSPATTTGVRLENGSPGTVLDDISVYNTLHRHSHEQANKTSQRQQQHQLRGSHRILASTPPPARRQGSPPGRLGGVRRVPRPHHHVPPTSATSTAADLVNTAAASAVIHNAFANSACLSIGTADSTAVSGSEQFAQQDEAKVGFYMIAERPDRCGDGRRGEDGGRGRRADGGRCGPGPGTVPRAVPGTVPDTVIDTVHGAPACDLSLSILGRTQRTNSVATSINSSGGGGGTQGRKGRGDTIMASPAMTGNAGGSRYRETHRGLTLGVGVAPAKLRRRVSNTRLAPLAPA